MERLIEGALLGARWLLLPLYLALLAALVAIYAMVGRELLHLASSLGSITDVDLTLVLLSVLDLVLVANLLVMVAVSSYESFISRIAVAEDASKPEWLGKLDSGNVKLKVMLSIVLISAIHLLRAFMRDGAGERLLVLAAVHLVFIASMLAIALVDRAHGGRH
ncbi:MAG: YqhA family protein [Rhodospirillales bacterium]|nr:YqhA family protein [Rhodospirillales bacterium]MDE2200251.1 YqhA family protein [Rhodospirillales bacterium]MDE2574950.1 YqhA family protein [Rhodospirillales bacterium]